MVDVLIDTSVWVAFFRRGSAPTWRPVLVDLVERDAIVIVEPIVAELLHGARSERERTVLLDLARGSRRARLDLDTWIACGELGRAWRARGRTLSIVDCLIAAVAIRDDLPLWTLDEDFEPLAQEGALRRFRVG
jgi:predicted nucleic acid-binding protein